MGISKIPSDSRPKKSARAIPLFIFAAIFAAAAACFGCVLYISGCRSVEAEVMEYLKTARGILHNITSKLADLRNCFSLPVNEQERAKEKLYSFRKVLKNYETKIDTAHPPEECMGLDEALRACIAEGRDIASACTPCVEYAASISRVLKEAGEIVGSASSTDFSKKPYPAVIGLEERANRLSASARAVFVSEDFGDVHRILLSFVDDLARACSEASRKVQASFDYESGEENARRGSTYLFPTRHVAGRWERTLGDMTAAFFQKLSSSRYQKENEEFDARVIQAQGEISSLEKQFGRKSGRKKAGVTAGAV